MSGLDRQRFVSLSDEDYEEMKCGICLGVLNKPVVTQCCQQSYCNQCITEWIKNSKTCPNCRKPLTAKKWFPAPRFSVNLIERLDICCEFKDNGCQHVCKLSLLDQHLKVCPHNPLNRCPYCQEVNTSDHNCGPQLRQQVDSLRAEAEALKTSNQKLSSISRKYKNKCIEWENRFGEEMRQKSEEYETLLTVNTGLDQQIQALRQEVLELKTKGSDMCEQNQSFSTENQKLRQELKGLRDLCDNCLKSKEVVEKSNQSLAQELSERTRELQTFSEQSVELNALRAENEVLKCNQFSNDQHICDVIKSARDHTRQPDIHRSKLSKVSQNIVINKMIESIDRNDTFREIAIDLKRDLEAYKRGVYWNTLVFCNSCCHSITYSNEDMIDVSFGALRLKLISV